MSSEFKKQIFQASTLAVDLVVTIDISICNLQSLVTTNSDRDDQELKTYRSLLNFLQACTHPQSTQVKAL